MNCYTCQVDKPLPYVVTDDDNVVGRECQNCHKKAKRRERGLRKPGPKPQAQRRTHCGVGHEMTEENTLWANDAARGRVRDRCRTCFRLSAIKRNYGLEPEEYTALGDAQSWRCGICDTPFGLNPRDTHVDHDHDTGAVRGLLCLNCNTGLGLLGDSTEGLAKAVNYLAKAMSYLVGE